MNNDSHQNMTKINHYPGHMAKTRRLIGEKIDLIDIVYEVIDARIPLSSKIHDIDSLVKNKEKILVMTKKDLCNLEITKKWVDYYKKEGYHVLLLDLKDNKDYLNLVKLTKELTNKIQEKRKEKGLKNKEIKALVVGIPNVGKSTLINKMAGKKVANAENRPGVTRNINFLTTSLGITLLDTPGILWPKFEDQNIALNIASIGSIKKEVLNILDIATHIINIYISYYPSVLTEIYGINEQNVLDTIDALGKKWGFTKGGEVDYNKTCDRIYNDVLSGKVKNITFDIWK